MKRKSNKKGFSLPMSVVFLLVVVMLTLVLTTAALSAAKQVHQKKLEKQAGLTVTGVAEVLGDAIMKMEFREEVVNKSAADEKTVVTVLSVNRNQEEAEEYTKLANALAGWIETAENDTTTYMSVSPALTIKEGTAEVKAVVTVYSSKGAAYPGDIVISLEDVSTKTGYTSAFRIYGQNDNVS